MGSITCILGDEKHNQHRMRTKRVDNLSYFQAIMIRLWVFKDTEMFNRSLKCNGIQKQLTALSSHEV